MLDRTRSETARALRVSERVARIIIEREHRLFEQRGRKVNGSKSETQKPTLDNLQLTVAAELGITPQAAEKLFRAELPLLQK